MKAAGYNGVEMALPLESEERRETLAILRAHQLELIGQYWQSFERNLDQHSRNYEKYLHHLAGSRQWHINVFMMNLLKECCARC